MGKALYRKYRPTSLAEVIGQEHITTVLSNALSSGKLAHAYLLTGPRGTGKTSIARILAHEVNKLDYSEEQHFDIIEIDAASNNGVEDVRELRDKIQSAPTSAAYKVYIIDEVHMLSKAAFNALLKTLEEPPAHVIFVLATTEVHKLPETIISRTQRFALRPVDKKKVVDHLKKIAKKESVDIDDNAINLIAEHGEGSFRDSISLLDQARLTSNSITLSQVEGLLGRAPHDLIEKILTATREGQPDMVMSTLHELYDQGYEASSISSQISRIIRSSIGNDNTLLDISTSLKLLRDLIDVPASTRSKQLLEVVLLAAAIPTQPAAKITPRTPAQEPSKEADLSKPSADIKPKPPTPEAAVPVAAEEDKPINPISDIKPNEETVDDTKNNAPPVEQIEEIKSVDLQELWQRTLQSIKSKYNTLYGVARMAKPTLEDGILVLYTKFPFHQKRLNEPRNRTIIADEFNTVSAMKVGVSCELGDRASETPASVSEQAPDDTISTISNIFGGAELIE